MPEPTPSEFPDLIGSVPAVLTPGAVVPVPDDGLGAVAGEPGVPARKRRFGPAAILAVAWIIFVVGGAILAPYLPIPKTTETVDIPIDAAGKPYLGPSASHPFGLDTIGKDVFSLTLYGGRVSLLVGFVAVSVGMVIGGTMGIFAGYLRGRVDAVLSVFFDTFLAIPAIILALALVAAFDPADPDLVNPTRRIFVLAGALGVVSIPVLGRIARASTLAVADREFVMAAKAMGAKPLRIMWREILPNVLPSMMVIGLLGVGVAIVAEGGLALLGASVSSPATSWGSIIAANRNAINLDQPWVIFGPSAFIFLTVLTLNYLGDVIRRRFDIRDSVL